MNQLPVSPSLLAAAARCDRRGWLAMHHITALPAPARPIRKKQHLPEQQGDWLYEVRLPSGARLDGWQRTEKVAVEYKTEEPHTAHVLQGWAYAKELHDLGIRHAEMQLWYPNIWKQKAQKLAEGMGLPFRLIKEIEMAVVWLNTPKVNFTETVQKGAQKLKEMASNNVPPTSKPRTAAACSACPYHDFCHL
jgi:CRISPR/Cas system-associated exonuclease Cas4 (RecB family)